MIAWGIKSNDLEGVVPLLADALHLRFFPHESSFRGGNYYRANASLGDVVLQLNCDSSSTGSEPFENGWPLDALIIYFDGPNEELWEPYTQALKNLAELGPVKLAGKSET